MDEVKLNTFLTVSKAGSFTRAADELFLSPISVKKQIDALEAELGEALFIRKATGCTLSAVGAAFMPHARKILKDIEDARKDVESMAINARGEIIAGHNITFNYKFVGSLSTGFSETNSKYIIQFQKYPRKDLIELLENHKINCVFAESTLLAENRSEIEFHPLVSLPVYAIMAKNHPLAAKESITFSDLTGQEIYAIRALGEDTLNLLKETASDLHYIEDTDRNVLFNRIVRGAVQIYPRNPSYYHCMPLEDRQFIIGIYALKSHPDIIENMIRYAKHFIAHSEDIAEEIM